VSAQAVAAAGALPLAGNLDDPAGLADAFASVNCDALVNLASLGFGHATGDHRRRVQGRAWTGPPSSPPLRSPPPCPRRRRRSGSPAEVAVRALRAVVDAGAADDESTARPATATCPGCSCCWRGPGAAGRCRYRCQFPAAARGCSSRCTSPTLAGAVLNAVERPQAVRRRYDVAGPEPLTFAELPRRGRATVGLPSSGSSRCQLTPAIAVTRGLRAGQPPAADPAPSSWHRLAEDKAFPIDDAVRDLDYAPRSFAAGIRGEAQALGLIRNTLSDNSEPKSMQRSHA